MKKALLVGLAALSTLGLLGCNKSNDANSKKEISIASSAELSTADVSLAMDNESAEVAEQVNEGLYDFDKTGQLKPALAAGMPKKSNNGSTYTINLKHIILNIMVNGVMVNLLLQQILYMAGKEQLIPKPNRNKPII